MKMERKGEIIERRELWQVLKTKYVGKGRKSELKVLQALGRLKIAKYARTGSYLAHNLHTQAANFTYPLLLPMLS